MNKRLRQEAEKGLTEHDVGEGAVGEPLQGPPVELPQLDGPHVGGDEGRAQLHRRRGVLQESPSRGDLSKRI